MIMSVIARAWRTGAFSPWFRARPGHGYQFIARLTRAYLNFELKDLRRPEAARLRGVLDFKVQMRFPAAKR
jgi:hypothetical protein